ncbi:hypothetical protein L195_g064407, partial [Trifolium pratense]
YFFLTLKKVVNVLNEDIPVLLDASASGTNDLTVTNGGEKLVNDKDKDQFDSAAAQVKAQKLQLQKEIHL